VERVTVLERAYAIGEQLLDRLERIIQLLEAILERSEKREIQRRR
jgi:hypothetical protein